MFFCAMRMHILIHPLVVNMGGAHGFPGVDRVLGDARELWQLVGHGVGHRQDVKELAGGELLLGHEEGRMVAL